MDLTKDSETAVSSLELADQAVQNINDASEYNMGVDGYDECSMAITRRNTLIHLLAWTLSSITSSRTWWIKL